MKPYMTLQPTVPGEPLILTPTPVVVTQCRPPSKIGCVQPQPVPLPKPVGVDFDAGAGSFELGFALLLSTMFKSFSK